MQISFRRSSDGDKLFAISASVLRRPKAILEVAGIKDVLTKSLGSDSPHNVAKATLQGLLDLRDPAEVCKSRGLTREELQERMN